MDSGRAPVDDAAETQASLLELRRFMDSTLNDIINATADYIYRHIFDEDDIPTIPSSAAAPTRASSRAAIEAPRDIDDRQDNCAICLDKGDAAAAEWKETPCGHRFHGGCLDRWLQGAAHTTCPLCRRHVMPPPREESTDDDDSEEEAAGESTHDVDDDPIVLFSPRVHLRWRRHEGDDDPHREHARRRFAYIDEPYNN